MSRACWDGWHRALRPEAFRRLLPRMYHREVPGPRPRHWAGQRVQGGWQSPCRACHEMALPPSPARWLLPQIPRRLRLTPSHREGRGRRGGWQHLLLPLLLPAAQRKLRLLAKKRVRDHPMVRRRASCLAASAALRHVPAREPDGQRHQSSHSGRPRAAKVGADESRAPTKTESWHLVNTPPHSNMVVS